MTGDGEYLDLRPKPGVGEQIVGWFKDVFSSRREQPETYEGWIPAGLAEGRLGLDTATVESLIRDGKLQSRRIGDAVLVLESDVDRLAKERIIVMKSVQEGSGARVESSEDRGAHSAPIVVVPPPKQGETIIEEARMVGRPW